MGEILKIDLLTPLTANFIPEEMEEEWDEAGYTNLDEGMLWDGEDLTPYASEIQEKIAEYSSVGHEDDKTDNLMDYFDGSAAIKEKVVSAVPSVKESNDVLYGCTTLELKELSGNERIIGTV